MAGGETAGIPFAAWVADRLHLPMQYVRKKPKGFGRGAQIEGQLLPGQRVLLVEDLATDGKSKVNFIKALREAGAACDHCFVIFFYDIYPQSKKILGDLGVTLHALTTWRDVLAVAKASGQFEPKMLAEVREIHRRPGRLVEGAWRGGGSRRVNSVPRLVRSHLRMADRVCAAAASPPGRAPTEIAKYPDGSAAAARA